MTSGAVTSVDGRRRRRRRGIDHPVAHAPDHHFGASRRLKDVRAEGAGQSTASSRIDRDVPMRWVILGSILIIAMMWVLLDLPSDEGAGTYWWQNLFAGIFVVVFGFFICNCCGAHQRPPRNSSNPISGMSIATLMATCAIFLLAGWTEPNYAVLALMIGGVVCIAAAIAGATSQDLKTGYLVVPRHSGSRWDFLLASPFRRPPSRSLSI